MKGLEARACTKAYKGFMFDRTTVRDEIARRAMNRMTNVRIGIKAPMRVHTYRAKARDEKGLRPLNHTAQYLRGDAEGNFMNLYLENRILRNFLIQDISTIKRHRKSKTIIFD